MKTAVEELRDELARAQAEGREIKARLAIAEGERDAALAQAEELTRGLTDARHDRDRARNALAHTTERLGRETKGHDVAFRALTQELAALRAIVDGRTTPPADAEIAAHAKSGWWLVSSPDDMSLELIEQPKERDWCIGWGANHWLPLDSDGRPCAWPVVPEAPRV